MRFHLSLRRRGDLGAAATGGFDGVEGAVGAEHSAAPVGAEHSAARVTATTW
jgi:hypothetical protein